MPKHCTPNYKSFLSLPSLNQFPSCAAIPTLRPFQPLGVKLPKPDKSLCASTSLPESAQYEPVEEGEHPLEQHGSDKPTCSYRPQQ